MPPSIGSDVSATPAGGCSARAAAAGTGPTGPPGAATAAITTAAAAARSSPAHFRPTPTPVPSQMIMTDVLHHQWATSMQVGRATAVHRRTVPPPAGGSGVHVRPDQGRTAPTYGM
ncbi:hypothetical protein GCM10009663_53770 [Kitasatospora arboriphila]|uniref:Uncharacterized protein n=1 Tax=Kitasatospora arboriphila TaxID=258052 RepID=A0ABN1TVG2_9ACTN